MAKFILKSFFKRISVIILSIFFLLILSIIAAGFTYEKKYAGKIYPGIKIGGINLGGASIKEAELKIQKLVDEINKNELSFSFEDISISISPIITSATDPAIAKEILTYHTSLMIKQIYNIGRNGKSRAENFLNQIKTLFHGERLLPIYDLNQDELLNILKDNFAEYEQPAANAQVKIKKNFEISLEAEKIGYAFDYEEAILALTKELDDFYNTRIHIRLTKKLDQPKIKKNNAAQSIERIKTILQTEKFQLLAGEKNWQIGRELLSDWFILSPPSENMNKNYLTFDREKVISYLKEAIVPEVNISPRNAKFEIKNGKVMEFQTSRDGVELDLERNYEVLINDIIESNKKEAELIIKEVKADITTTDVNNLGIKEIIGIGESNFKGSPKNRRHNIRTGAETLNGILINPTEEFSLIKALGKIDAGNGYLPELVIKGNKTIPEYGGGLCQIGTTLFRTTLSAGLPITERQNHSYRVSYYEPAGTDATIYDPKPDLKFINDANSHILIQTRIEGDDLIFEFWGMKDGRKIEKTEPKIYNIVKPLPTKLIETDDMKPGEKKCTEHAHNGADAEFNYKITYPDNKITERTFKSHYTPWREICLIGKEISNANETASSTEQIIAE